jgi:hypothetical protein
MSHDLATWRPDRVESGAVCSSKFQIGGVLVQLAAQDSADVALLPSLEPFRVHNGVSDIDIQIEWASSLRPGSGPKLFDSGCTWRLHEHEHGFQFDFYSPIFGNDPYRRLIVDGEFRRATLTMNGACFEHRVEAAPLGYPLDELLITHRLIQDRAIELHGCGIIGPDGAGNLFIGHSGAGKSTTARLWTEHGGVEILSDDRIIVRRQAEMLAMYGTPWHGEANFALPESAPLSRIFVLEHGYGNTLTRLSRSEAVAELFVRSFVPFHRHDFVDRALGFLEEVAGFVPCYRYSFEPDQNAVERILNFRD